MANRKIKLIPEDVNLLKQKSKRYREAHPLPKPSTALQLRNLNALSMMFFQGGYKKRPDVFDMMNICFGSVTKNKLLDFLEDYK